eukprot:g19145.t1
MYDSIGLPLPYLLGVLTTMVIVPTLQVFFSTLCFFLTFSISLVGSAVGAYRLGGVRLMCTRRGMGLTYLPETIVGRLLHLPPHPSRETGLWERFSWWRRMSDRELEAFVDVWNKLLQERISSQTWLNELRGRDLVCDRELEFLSFRSTQEAFQGHVPRLFQALSLRATLPANGEARRRIVSLARSVQMDPLPKAKVMDMPTLSVLIPHYSETIRYSKKDLKGGSLAKKGRCESMFQKVIPNWDLYRDEFRNFIERLEANDLAFGSHGLEAALCEWASLRMQTLWRTVDGICGAYAHALDILSQYQAPEQHGTKAAVRQRLQVVVAMQQSLGVVAGGDLVLMRQSYAQPGFYSCLIDASCEQIPIEGFEDVYARRAKYRVELPGFPILGHGKSDNQNCAMIFTRGEVLQMIDANQDAYFEASLFLPSALQEFCGPEKTLKGRPGIVGFREHIFSAVGLLGRLAADSEFTFGTMIQRTAENPRAGRDMGFMSVLSFYAKVSMGNAEQALTRQWMRLGLHLELSQLLGVFYSHIGFYMNQCLVNRATKEGRPMRLVLVDSVRIEFGCLSSSQNESHVIALGFAHLRCR